MISAEKEYQYLQSQIADREKQIDGLKREVIKSNSEVAFNLNLVRAEKEEKDRLFVKCQNLEDDAKANIREITDLKSQQIPHQQSSAKVFSVNEEKFLLIENENRKLHQDFRALSEKLKNGSEVRDE